MLFHPCSDSGQLQSEISQVRSKVDSKANIYDLDSLRSRVDSLESSLREVSSQVNNMEYRLQELEEDKRQKELG